MKMVKTTKMILMCIIGILLISSHSSLGTPPPGGNGMGGGMGRNGSTQVSNDILDAEFTLFSKLFDDSTYSSQVTPISRGLNGPVNVKMNLQQKNFIGIDIKDQTIQIQVLVTFMWQDEQLKWNYSDTPIRQLFVSTDNIWYPDVLLYNTARDEAEKPDDIYTSKVQVNEKGECKWVNSVNLIASCELDVRWFPLDSQRCNLSFASLSYPIHRLKLRRDKSAEDIEKKRSTKKGAGSNVENGEWDVKWQKIYEEDLKLECCEFPFSIISYEILFVRRPAFYFLYLLIPWLMLSALYLLTFHIYDERFGFGTSMILTMTVYVLIASDLLPRGSRNTPIIGICFLLLFMIFCFGMVAATWTLHMRNKEEGIADDYLLRFRWRVLSCCSRKHKDVYRRKKGGALQNGGLQLEEVNKSHADGKSNPTMNSEPEDNESDDYFVDWPTMGRFLDKFFFWTQLAIFILVPVLSVFFMLATPGASEYLGLDHSPN